MPELIGQKQTGTIVTRSVARTEWHPASWQSLAAAQQPSYPDKAALERAIADLSRLPPIVTTWEIEAKDEVDVISKGTHERFSIDFARFNARVAKKAGAK